jgi:hypothetical protein
MVMSGLAGVAAALAVAILLSVYFRTGYRTAREVVRHVLTAAFVLALLAFVAYDMRQAALAYLGINPAKGRRPHRHRPPTGRPNGRPMTDSGGRSSIPEAAVIESRGRGVLDTPHSRV